MADLPFGNYRAFDPSLPVGSCNCAYSDPYNEQCEFYHKEYHMGGYISTCLNQDVFGWCECNRCSKKQGGLTMAELKPCPFCGGKPYMAQNYLGQKYVRCTECGACVWGKDLDDWRIATMGEKKAEKAAAEAWNRRAGNG